MFIKSYKFVFVNKNHYFNGLFELKTIKLMVLVKLSEEHKEISFILHFLQGHVIIREQA